MKGATEDAEERGGGAVRIGWALVLLNTIGSQAPSRTEGAPELPTASPLRRCKTRSNQEPKAPNIQPRIPCVGRRFLPQNSPTFIP